MIFVSILVAFSWKRISAESLDLSWKQFVEQFDMLIFSEKRDYVVRWEKAIRIKPFGEASTATLKVFRKTMEDIEISTSHPFVISGFDSANLIVVFSDNIVRDSLGKFRVELAKVLPKDINLDDHILKKPRNCYVEVKTENKEITRAIFFVGTHLGPKFAQGCIASALPRLMGVVGTASFSEPRLDSPESIFRKKSALKSITLFDRQVLAILYDKSLNSGMSRKNVSEILNGRGFCWKIQYLGKC